MQMISQILNGRKIWSWTLEQSSEVVDVEVQSLCWMSCDERFVRAKGERVKRLVSLSFSFFFSLTSRAVLGRKKKKNLHN